MRIVPDYTLCFFLYSMRIHSKQKKLKYQTFLSSAGATKPKMVLSAGTRAEPLLRNLFGISGTKKGSLSKIWKHSGFVFLIPTLFSSH